MTAQLRPPEDQKIHVFIIKGGSEQVIMVTVVGTGVSGTYRELCLTHYTVLRVFCGKRGSHCEAVSFIILSRLHILHCNHLCDYGIGTADSHVLYIC